MGLLDGVWEFLGLQAYKTQLDWAAALGGVWAFIGLPSMRALVVSMWTTGKRWVVGARFSWERYRVISDIDELKAAKEFREAGPEARQVFANQHMRFRHDITSSFPIWCGWALAVLVVALSALPLLRFFWVPLLMLAGAHLMWFALSLHTSRFGRIELASVGVLTRYERRAARMSERLRTRPNERLSELQNERQALLLVLRTEPSIFH
nr:hypothetical protein [Nitrosomonas nitrosa]